MIQGRNERSHGYHISLAISAPLLRTLTEGTEVYNTNGDFNHCAGNPGNRKEVGFWDNPRYFVRGIAVCSSKTGNKERRKGIKLYAAKAHEAGGGGADDRSDRGPYELRDLERGGLLSGGPRRHRADHPPRRPVDHGARSQVQAHPIPLARYGSWMA